MEFVERIREKDKANSRKAKKLGCIIDTDICIDLLKGQKFAIELFENILKSGSYFISILTYYELLKGAYAKGQRDTVENFASLIDILAINEIIIKIGAIF